MYKIVLPHNETIFLSALERRLYLASNLAFDGYKIVQEGKYKWIIITPQEKRYTVEYKKGMMTCNCPDAKFRAKKFADGWCKHKLFVLTQTELDNIVVCSLLAYPWLTKYLRKI